MKHLLLLSSLALVALVGPSPAYGQTGVPLWTNLYNGPGNYDDYAEAIAVDSNGNVFVTGEADGGSSSRDFATIKYSGAGVPLWINLYNGPADGNDSGSALAVDSSGNVFVTGSSVGSGSSYDYATIKYSGAGVPLWTNRYNGPENGDDQPKALAVDSSGNVFVTGAAHSGDYFSTPSDYATIKYSSAGVALWTNRYNGPGNSSDRAVAVKVDGSNNVIVTGSSVGSSSNSDYATIKYSGAGVPLWTNRYNGPGNGDDSASAVAVDGSGNVIVTGSSGSIFSDPDYTTIKYSGAGVPLWTNRYNGTANAYDLAKAVAVDGSGNVFVTGGTDGDYNAVGSRYATIKYSSAGPPVWTNRYPQTGNQDTAYGMAVDGSGNVIVTGLAGASATTIKYSGAGMPLWTNRYDGTGNDIDGGSALAVDASGNVFMTGYSYEKGSSTYDYVTIKYAATPLLTIARTTTNTVAISWPSPWTSFTLQQNTNSLATANWSNVLTTPINNGTTKTVIVNPPNGNRYFRLSSP